jgi:hypothetical protein
MQSIYTGGETTREQPGVVSFAETVGCSRSVMDTSEIIGVNETSGQLITQGNRRQMKRNTQQKEKKNKASKKVLDRFFF